MYDANANGDTGMDAEQLQGQGGYCIEIYVGSDNSVQSVKVERKDGAGGQDDTAMAETEGGRSIPVTSMEEAVQAAMAIHGANGELPVGNSPEDDAMRGYQKGGGPVRGIGIKQAFGSE